MNLLKMRTRSALRKNQSLRYSIPYKQAKSVGIVFSIKDQQTSTDIKEFIHILEQDGKQVKVLEFLPTKKENYESLFDFFSIEDLSFLGKINSEHAINFSKTSFDFLFYVDVNSNSLVLDLLARSKAHCRIGRYCEEESPYFEMMIKQEGTSKGLIETMYKYAKQLR
ncbi:MAG: hypothetical protein ORN54_11455 [Cyclobacteriaceae bacterium]|nr:hypothetical protein [Cyclobacteriaceae bacterium]